MEDGYGNSSKLSFALGTACSVVMAAGLGLWTALNATDLGWWVFLGVAAALAFAANLKSVLHPALRVVAALAQILCAGAMIVSFLFVMSIAEAGAGAPWWVVPLALALIAVCVVATVAGVRAFRARLSPRAL
jgi:hypothetical protein